MPIRILILGLLLQQERHPYEVLQQLKAIQAERYIKLNYGKLYYAFDRLAADGLIEIRRTEQEAGRPERRVYGITTAGKERFPELVLTQFRKSEPLYHPFYPALFFAHQADQLQLKRLLEERLARLEQSVLDMKQLIALWDSRIPRGALSIMRNGLLHEEAELTWTREFLAELDPM